MKPYLAIYLSLLLFSFTVLTPKPPKARITVIDENNNIVVGATVTLFNTFADYQAETNAVESAVTNEKGFVEFTNLTEDEYFVLAEKGHLNNHGGHNHIDKLREKGKHRFEIMIN